jgi:hypothetical protein
MVIGPINLLLSRKPFKSANFIDRLLPITISYSLLNNIKHIEIICQTIKKRGLLIPNQLFLNPRFDGKYDVIGRYDKKEYFKNYDYNKSNSIDGILF